MKFELEPVQQAFLLNHNLSILGVARGLRSQLLRALCKTEALLAFRDTFASQAGGGGGGYSPGGGGGASVPPGGGGGAP